MMHYHGAISAVASELGRRECTGETRGSETLPGRRLGGGQFGDDGRPAILEAVSALRQRDAVPALVHRAEVLALLLEGRAEARGGHEAAEPAQRVVALLHATVILLDTIVFVATGAVMHPRPQRLADGARVGVVPVGRHLPGRMTGSGRGCGEEPPISTLV